MIDSRELFVVNNNGGEPVRITYFNGEEYSVDFIKNFNDVLFQPLSNGLIMGYVFYTKKGEKKILRYDEKLPKMVQGLIDKGEEFSFRNIYNEGALYYGN